VITVDVDINATLVSRQLSRVRCLQGELGRSHDQVMQTVPVQVDSAKRSAKVLAHLRAFQVSYVLQILVFIILREVEQKYLQYERFLSLASDFNFSRR
jgi:hypothetical protein